MSFCDRIFLWQSHVPAISSRGSVYPWYLPMSMCPCGLQYVPVAVCPCGLRCLPVAVCPRCIFLLQCVRGIFQWQCVHAVSSRGSVSMLYLPVAVCSCGIFICQCVPAIFSRGKVSRGILPWHNVPWYPPVAGVLAVSSRDGQG